MMLSIFLGVCDSNLKSVAFFVTQAIFSFGFLRLSNEYLLRASSRRGGVGERGEGGGKTDTSKRSVLKMNGSSFYFFLICYYFLFWPHMCVPCIVVLVSSNTRAKMYLGGLRL